MLRDRAKIVIKAVLPRAVKHWIHDQIARIHEQYHRRENRRLFINLARYSKAENTDPLPASLKLVQEITEEIKPDMPILLGWYKDYAIGQRRRVAFDIEYVQQYLAKTDNILEVGSTPLLFSGALRKLGYNIYGVDILPERFQETAVRLDIPVKKCDIELEKLPFLDAYFDGIIFNEIFEHLRINLIFTFSEVFRVMRPGGVLLLSTPNLRCLEGIINFIFLDSPCSNSGSIYEEYEKLQTIGHMGHVREYTIIEICEFLENVGFIIKGVINRGQYQSKWKRMVTQMFPTLRPFVTIVATKY